MKSDVILPIGLSSHTVWCVSSSLCFFTWCTVLLVFQYGFVGRWLNPGKGTIGALDLGGASTQITFVTSEKEENPDDAMNLTLYGQNYKLYTHSYLCYGQDQFLRKLLAYLITVCGMYCIKIVLTVVHGSSLCKI